MFKLFTSKKHAPDGLTTLPDDTLTNTIQYLNINEKMKVSVVNKTLCPIVNANVAANLPELQGAVTRLNLKINALNILSRPQKLRPQKTYHPTPVAHGAFGCYIPANYTAVGSYPAYTTPYAFFEKRQQKKILQKKEQLEGVRNAYQEKCLTAMASP